MRLSDSNESLDYGNELTDIYEMIGRFYHHYIERIEPGSNMARFYSLGVQPTLFGDYSLMRCWGRIGTRGQCKEHIFAEEEDATSQLLTFLQAKTKRGYKAPVRITPGRQYACQHVRVA